MKADVTRYGETDGVLWIDISEGIYSYRMVGFDYYWYDVERNEFGFYDEPMENIYRFVADNDGMRFLDNALPREGIIVLPGIYVTDEKARELGII